MSDQPPPLPPEPKRPESTAADSAPAPLVSAPSVEGASAPTTASSAVVAAAAPPVELGWTERLSDRVNPLLVREIHQALSGRAFLGLLALSSAAVLMLGLTFVGGEGADIYGTAGAEAFGITSACLVPLAMLFIPSQTFSSMRQEVQGGAVDQLSMTRMRPRGVLLGKLLAGLVQLMLLMSVFAPVLALTWLLRGIDIVTILVGILMLLVLGAAANAFAAAMASVPGKRSSQQVTQAVTAMTLIVPCIALIGMFSRLPVEMARAFSSSAEVWLSVLLLFGVLAIVGGFSLALGVASLSHPFENRSAPFRVFAVGGLFGAYTLLSVGLESTDLREAIRDVATIAPLILGPIWAYACSEDDRMSPRVRVHVPTRRRVAALIAPFLPGAPRGLLLLLLLASGSLAVAGFVPEWLTGRGVGGRGMAQILIAWGYALFFGSVIALARSRFAKGQAGSRTAFGLFLGLVIAVTVFPPLVQAMVYEVVPRGWTYWNVLDPFRTVSASGSKESARTVGFLIGGVGAVLAVLHSVRGVKQILSLSKENAARQARTEEVVDAA